MDDDGWPGYLEITGTVWAKSLWKRLKAATLVLRGRHYYNDGIMLDEETSIDLMNTLSEYIAAERARKGKENDSVQPAT